VNLEHDPARLHAARPVIDAALALAHTDFGRLRRDRHIRIDTDPHASGALHLAGDRAAGRLDLARGDAVRFERLQPVPTEIEICSALSRPMDTTLELLAEFRALWLQHLSLLQF